MQFKKKCYHEFLTDNSLLVMHMHGSQEWGEEIDVKTALQDMCKYGHTNANVIYIFL